MSWRCSVSIAFQKDRKVANTYAIVAATKAEEIFMLRRGRGEMTVGAATDFKFRLDGVPVTGSVRVRPADGEVWGMGECGLMYLSGGFEVRQQRSE